MFEILIRLYIILFNLITTRFDSHCNVTMYTLPVLSKLITDTQNMMIKSVTNIEKTEVLVPHYILQYLLLLMKKH